MVNKYPGHFLLMPSTVMLIGSLKIQRKTRKTVTTAGIKTGGENGCKYHFGLVNVRSIKSKEQALVNYITEKDFDIVLMNETWLKPDKAEACKSASCLNRNG